jgi:hypothetical protein
VYLKKLRWWSETAQPGDVYPYEHFLPFFDQNLHLPDLGAEVGRKLVHVGVSQERKRIRML